jgi:hypothetical protein
MSVTQPVPLPPLLSYDLEHLLKATPSTHLCVLIRSLISLQPVCDKWPAAVPASSTADTVAVQDFHVMVLSWNVNDNRWC